MFKIIVLKANFDMPICNAVFSFCLCSTNQTISEIETKCDCNLKLLAKKQNSLDITYPIDCVSKPDYTKCSVAVIYSVILHNIF